MSGEVVVVAGVVLGAALLSFAIWVLWFKKDADLAKKVARFRQEIAVHGTRTTARVVQINDMEATTGGNICLDWILEIRLPSGEKYELSEDQLECEKRFCLNDAYSSYVGRKGASIPVVVHPRHRELIQIDEHELLKLVRQSEPEVGEGRQ
jgi:hypothetical protein